MAERISIAIDRATHARLAAYAKTIRRPLCAVAAVVVERGLDAVAAPPLPDLAPPPELAREGRDDG